MISVPTPSLLFLLEVFEGMRGDLGRDGKMEKADGVENGY